MRRTSLVVAAVVGGYAGLQWLGRAYGATRAERRRPLPGDGLCAHPQMVTTHAVTIDAPPEHVWPWLVQMGWGRGQWYTARWVDRLLFPANGPSADVLVPEWQELAVGDRVLDGPPEADCAFVVDDLDPPRYLVLHSREHLPPGWADRFGAGVDWTWVFVLEPVAGGRTRFLFRTRVRLSPWWVTAVYWTVMVPADLVMSRQMLRGVRKRAERTTAADLVRLASRAIAPAAADIRPGTTAVAAEQRGPVRPLGRN
ncbi:hypothetical protein [Geodermatophilus sp. SYSU D00766]